jgi:hypothetical protein
LGGSLTLDGAMAAVSRARVAKVREVPGDLGKAHVRNGYFVSDEPANLPEGTPVELQLVTTDPWTEMDPEERAELEEAIEEGYRDIQNGDVVDARKFLAELRAIRA